MNIDDFTLDTRYNRKGPETCLTDEDFIYLWNYFKTNLLHNFSYAYVLRNVLGLYSEQRLPAMAILTNKEAVLDFLNNESDRMGSLDMLYYARVGIAFCCRHWIAARFHNSNGTTYEQLHYCLEDIKYLIKVIAESRHLI